MMKSSCRKSITRQVMRLVRVDLHRKNLAQPCRSDIVGGIECFDGELREGHLGGCSKHRGRRDERKSANRSFQLQRNRKRFGSRGRAGCFRSRAGCKSRELLQERGEFWIGGCLNPVSQAAPQVGAPLRQIRDLRRESSRVQAQSQHVHWRREQRRVLYATEKRRDRIVGTDHVPVAIYRERGIRRVAAKYRLNYVTGRRKGRVGIQRQIELGAAPLLPPCAQLTAEGGM